MLLYRAGTSIMTRMVCKINSYCSSSPEITKGYCLRHYKQLRTHGGITNTGEHQHARRRAIIDGDIAKIPLGIDAKDGYAIIDASDSWVDKSNWHKSKTGYPSARINGKLVTLHVLLTNPQSGLEVDHKDHDKLNNRRSNLRVGTHAQNEANKHSPRNTSGYKGVCYDKSRGTWVARIKAKHIGRFKTKEEAAQAYNTKAKELFGEFALLNDITLTPTTNTTRGVVS